MTPAELRTLMATAERQPGETTEQFIAREIAEHQLSSWRVWLPALLVTPCARWHFEGKPDPHGTRYECERADLIGGQMTDDEVANAAYLDPTITNLTIAKDRIRWLSRRLAALETLNPIAPASQAGTRAPAAVRPDPAGAHSLTDITPAEAEARGLV